MKIWLPHILVGSGLDVYTKQLAEALESSGHQVVTTSFSHYLQYMPWVLKAVQAPPGTDIVVANTWNGFAFRRTQTSLVVVEHHCVFDPIYTAYRSFPQMVFHEGMIKYFEKASLKAADALVAVSRFTAKSIEDALGGPKAEVIHNGVDTDFFSPGRATVHHSDNLQGRLLFVGNLTRRKGSDLLPKIMRELGDGYKLYYTRGLRTKKRFETDPNMIPLKNLSQEAIRQEYRKADVLLFPSRLEGFGYVVAESMACGTPVVTTDCSSLSELVEDGVNGRLCPVDDIMAFVNAIRELIDDPVKVEKMGQQARFKAVKHFSVQRMIDQYLSLFNRLLAS